MKNISLFISFWLLGWAFMLKAQGEYSSAVQGPITPSVAGMSYGKYADLPINPLNGTMGFSIPIAGISDGPLATDVSLSYHTGGIRVAELASEVGLGWHLNASGVISRTVNGLPDDAPDGYWHKGNTLLQDFSTQAGRDERDKAAKGTLDTEPDLFFYKVNGITGKFIIDKDHKVQMIPKSNIKVEVSFNGSPSYFEGFTLTGTDGTEYWFGFTLGEGADGKQSTTVGLQKSYIDTWFLTRIFYFDDKHFIKFIYQTNSYAYKVNSDCHIIKYFDTSEKIAQDACTGKVQTDVKIDGRILSSISTSSGIGMINFTASGRSDLLSFNSMSGKRMDAISVNNGDKCFKYQFTYGAFYDSDYGSALSQRLKLESLQKISCTSGSTDKEEPYTFTYIGAGFLSQVTNTFVQFFPSLTNKNIDHWGYYNYNSAVGSNTSSSNLIPTTSVTVGSKTLTHGSAKRQTEGAAMQLGVLNKITYPTKGFTQLTYEPNEYRETSSNWQALFAMVETCGQTSGACCALITKPTTPAYTFSTDVLSTGVLTVTVQNDGSFVNCTPGNNYVQLVTRNASNGNTIVNELTFDANLYGVTGIKTVTKNFNELPGLTAGHAYTFTLSSGQARGTLEVTYAPTTANVLAGGLRIKEILTNDNNGNEIKRGFSYTQGNTTTSSGILTNKPTYGLNLDGTNGLFASTGVLPLSNSEGTHIFYTDVKEDFNGNGHKKYVLGLEYFNPNQQPAFPARASLYVVNDGMLKEQYTYNQL